MLISEIIREGRKLYAQCDRCRRRVPLDLSQFPPDLDHIEFGKRLKCSQCGNAKVLAIPQTTRQMRQGRER
jgi:hypothetical protein